MASDNKLEVIISTPPKEIDEPDTEHDPQYHYLNNKLTTLNLIELTIATSYNNYNKALLT